MLQSAPSQVATDRQAKMGMEQPLEVVARHGGPFGQHGGIER